MAGTGQPGSAGRIESIDALARPILSDRGYDLEEVAVRPGGERREVRLVVDRDGGAGLDELAEISRDLSAVFDEAGVLGEEPYDLEVTTPGIGRPMTAPRHWRRARGRKVAVTWTGDDGAEQQLTARVADSDDDAVTLLTNDKGRFTETRIMLASVVSAAVDVDFTRPGQAELRRCGLDDDEIARRRAPAH